MQPSRRDLSSERKRELNQEQLISQPVPKPLEELGEGRRENEHCDESDPERNQSSSNRPEEEEVDRPDLELNYQGNSLVIDLDPLEWMALAILIVIGAWLLHQP